MTGKVCSALLAGEVLLRVNIESGQL